MCATRAHLRDDSSFGNHLTWLLTNPRCAWTCWLGGKARLLGRSSFFPCSSRKPPAMWHSQSCHPEQHQPASYLLSLPLHAPSLVRAVGLPRAEEHLQRLPVSLVILVLCVSLRSAQYTCICVFPWPGFPSVSPSQARSRGSG